MSALKENPFLIANARTKARIKAKEANEAKEAKEANKRQNEAKIIRDRLIGKLHKDKSQGHVTFKFSERKEGGGNNYHHMFINKISTEDLQIISDFIDNNRGNALVNITYEPTSNKLPTYTLGLATNLGNVPPNQGIVPPNDGIVPPDQGNVPLNSSQPRHRNNIRYKDIDELINGGLFSSCLNVLETDEPKPHDARMLNQALLFFPEIQKDNIKKTSLKLITSILSRNQQHFEPRPTSPWFTPGNTELRVTTPAVLLQERRNALMLWPEAWNSMTVDEFATQILALIGPQTEINKNAYKFIRLQLNKAIDTTKPTCTLRDVLSNLEITTGIDVKSDAYMEIPLDKFIHLKKILVRHTLIYNITPLIRVIELFNRLSTSNATDILTMNNSIVPSILFGVYDVHDPTSYVRDQGIVVGFDTTFLSMWRSEQQVKSHVFFSGKTVKNSGINKIGKPNNDDLTKFETTNGTHDNDYIDLYGKFRNDPTYETKWNNPEPRIVPIFIKLLNKYNVVENELKREDVLLDTLRAIWTVPGPETSTFIHMFTDKDPTLIKKVFKSFKNGPFGNSYYALSSNPVTIDEVEIGNETDGFQVVKVGDSVKIRVKNSVSTRSFRGGMQKIPPFYYGNIIEIDKRNNEPVLIHYDDPRKQDEWYSVRDLSPYYDIKDRPERDALQRAVPFYPPENQGPGFSRGPYVQTRPRGSISGKPLGTNNIKNWKGGTRRLKSRHSKNKKRTRSNRS